MGYIRHVGHAGRSSKNHMRLLGLEYAKFSLREKWNNCLHPYRTVIVEGINYHRAENTPPDTRRHMTDYYNDNRAYCREEYLQLRDDSVL